jgi:hypothetical protein
MKTSIKLSAVAAVLAGLSFNTHAIEYEYGANAGLFKPITDIIPDDSYQLGFQIRAKGADAPSWGGMKWGGGLSYVSTDGRDTKHNWFYNQNSAALNRNVKMSLLQTYVFADQALHLTTEFNTFYRIMAGFSRIETANKFCFKNNSGCPAISGFDKEEITALTLGGGIGAYFTKNLEGLIMLNRASKMNYLYAGLSYKFDL